MNRGREALVEAPARATSPRRTCVGCRQVRSVDELTRVTLTGSGELCWSSGAEGRGAWLCRAGAAKCAAAAAKHDGWSRAFRRPVSREQAGRLLEQIVPAEEKASSR